MKPLYEPDYPSFSPHDRRALLELVKRIEARRVLEIGSWLGGGSTQALASTGANVFCLDHWQGSPGVAGHREIVERFDVLGTFMRNVAPVRERIRILVMDSAEASQILADASFDLVFIDADHSYDATLRDIRGFASKVRPGGILCGHDCEGRPDDYGRALLEANKAADCIPAERFPQIHPGCILAVDEAFGGKARLFAEQPFVQDDGSPACSTIWYVET